MGGNAVRLGALFGGPRAAVRALGQADAGASWLAPLLAVGFAALGVLAVVARRCAT